MTLTGLAVTTASPASALSYHCTKQTRTFDTPQYSGPWADNWDFTVTNCAARSGSYVYARSTVSWDGPVGGGGSDFFDSASLRVYVKKSVSGSDPVKTYKTYGFTSKANYSSSGNYNGSFTTGTIRYKIGSAKGLGDGALRLNWNNDGKGVYSYGYKASPRV
ncbi:hypothetical protein [Streptomyces sp. NBC_01445]|uniref:hypothetical protein n=1 Tax=Streptomyces sp. NBC_01445 TaxID=2903869 RepID=UPI002DD834FC|nr:hypothetical protein [Streptomyces sp. NBC_01445]WSE11539.1 hypothetical protein OG574_51115 [Streptomyces sp. NBC_01445]